MDKPIFNSDTLIAWGHDPYYKTEFESALRDGKIFLQDGVHFDNIKTLLDDYKPTPIKKVNIMQWNPNIDEVFRDGTQVDLWVKCEHNFCRRFSDASFDTKKQAWTTSDGWIIKDYLQFLAITHWMIVTPPE